MDTVKEPAGRSGLEVGAYYDATLDAFGAVFDGSIHVGYWSRGATTLLQAQTDLTDVVLDACQVPSGGRLLDLGCGQGGPAIHAAQRLDVHVTGVTVSAGQVEQATAAAERACVTSLVDFAVADMTRLPFPDASFDSAYAIESLLFHVADKAAAFAEIARVLRPGAALVAADYALTRDMPVEDRHLAEQVLFTAPLLTEGQMNDLAVASGLAPVRVASITTDVRASAAALTGAAVERREALVACVGQEGFAAITEAIAQYNRIYVEAQDYVLLEARRLR